MVEGVAADGGTAAITVLTAVTIALNIAATSFARLVGSIFVVPLSLLASLAIGDASPDSLSFAALFPLAMLG